MHNFLQETSVYKACLLQIMPVSRTDFLKRPYITKLNRCAEGAPGWAEFLEMTVTMKKFTQGILGYTKGTALRLADKVITEAELAMANKKIEEQAAELKRLNEDLEQLSYIISHDLKAPVRHISSFMKYQQLYEIDVEPLQ